MRFLYEKIMLYKMKYNNIKPTEFLSDESGAVLYYQIQRMVLYLISDAKKLWNHFRKALIIDSKQIATKYGCKNCFVGLQILR